MPAMSRPSSRSSWCGDSEILSEVRACSSKQPAYEHRDIHASLLVNFASDKSMPLEADSCEVLIEFVLQVAIQAGKLRTSAARPAASLRGSADRPLMQQQRLTSPRSRQKPTSCVTGQSPSSSDTRRKSWRCSGALARYREVRPLIYPSE